MSNRCRYRWTPKERRCVLPEGHAEDHRDATEDLLSDARTALAAERERADRAERAREEAHHRYVDMAGSARALVKQRDDSDRDLAAAQARAAEMERLRPAVEDALYGMPYAVVAGRHNRSVRALLEAILRALSPLPDAELDRRIIARAAHLLPSPAARPTTSEPESQGET